MGIKDNFDNALRKAITLDPIGYREILKNSNDIEEVKTHKGKKCNEVHPGVLHSKWVNQKPEEEMDEATTQRIGEVLQKHSGQVDNLLR